MKKIAIILALIMSLLPVAVLRAASLLTGKLEGKILLQVESHGEAWYVYKGEKRYMADGNSAYEIMRFLGLGITDSDLAIIPFVTDPEEMKRSSSVCSYNSVAYKVRGKILLQVQKSGEAWYVDTDKCRRIYMKDGNAAYQIMRFLSLGIKNRDLDGILTNNASPSLPQSSTSVNTSPVPPLTPQQIKATLKNKIVVVSGSLSQGSGFFISNGQVITNAHVVEGEDYFDILTTDNKSYPAYVVGRDEPNDIALLEVTGSHPVFSSVVLADSDVVESGEDVYALGYPLGLGTNLTTGIELSITKGILSSGHQVVNNQVWLQSDVSIDHGSSGGPLVNEKAQVIGVSTWGPAAATNDLAFFIPSNRVTSILSQLKAGEISLNTVPPSSSINKNSPDAEKYRNFDIQVNTILQNNQKATDKYKAGIEVWSNKDLSSPYFEACMKMSNENHEHTLILAPAYSISLTVDLRESLQLLTQSLTDVCWNAKILSLASGVQFDETSAKYSEAIENYNIFLNAVKDKTTKIISQARALGYID